MMLMDFNDQVLCSIAVCLDDVKPLGRLACVARRFNTPVFVQQGEVASLSVIDEAARVLVRRWPQAEQDKAPRADEPWLRILAELHALAKPIRFTRFDATYIRPRETWVGMPCDTMCGCEVVPESAMPACGRLAVCAGYRMRAGVHYAEVQLNMDHLFFGIASAHNFPVNEVVMQTGEFWGIYTQDGNFVAAYDNYEGGVAEMGLTYPGMETFARNDKLGLRVDVDRRTMTVYKNRRRLGVALRDLDMPMQNGKACCFAVGLFDGWIQLELGPPPELSAEERAKEEEESREFGPVSHTTYWYE